MNKKVLMYLETNHCFSCSSPLPELSSIQRVFFFFNDPFVKDQAENTYKKAHMFCFVSTPLNEYFRINVSLTWKLNCQEQAYSTAHCRRGFKHVCSKVVQNLHQNQKSFRFVTQKQYFPRESNGQMQKAD